MFNSLASYILGNGYRNATDITQDGQQLSGASDEAINNFKFVTTNCEDEDEWLLVEKGGNLTVVIAYHKAILKLLSN